jgi:hypothetical protein
MPWTIRLEGGPRRVSVSRHCFEFLQIFRCFNHFYTINLFLAGSGCVVHLILSIYMPTHHSHFLIDSYNSYVLVHKSFLKTA